MRRICSLQYLPYHLFYILPSGQVAGFPIQGSRVQNHRVAPRSTQPFILPRLIKLVPRISGNLVVKNKLQDRSKQLKSQFFVYDYSEWLFFYISIVTRRTKRQSLSQQGCENKHFKQVYFILFSTEYIFFK